MTITAEDLDRLYDNAAVSLPGSLLGAIQMELFNVLDDFCRYTNVWQEWIDFVVNPATVDVHDTITITPTDGQIIRLMATIDADRRIISADMAQPGLLRLRQIPGSTSTWTAIVSKTVENADPLTDNAPEVPEWLVPQYRDAILHGIQGKMMAHPSKPYSNGKLAEFHLKAFRSKMNEARVDVNHKNRFGSNTWSFPQGFMPSRPSRIW